MKTYLVDSFTETPFKGNPAGVCLVESSLSDDLMQRVAQELNLSETAFIQQHAAEEVYSIRFFSPKMEIPLCGHATLAAARVVMNTRGTGRVVFINGNGLRLIAAASGERISMEFPVYPTERAEAPVGLLAALGVRAIENAAYNNETRILLLEITDPAELASLTPDFSALYRSHDGINGVLVTAPSRGDDGYDFHSRYFWPWSGSDEDPVTGGTHTFLAKYWADRLGKTRMKSFQSSGRTGSMEVELRGDTLLITSQAVIVLEGELKLGDALV